MWLLRAEGCGWYSRHGQAGMTLLLGSATLERDG